MGCVRTKTPRATQPWGYMGSGKGCTGVRVYVREVAGQGEVEKERERDRSRGRRSRCRGIEKA